MEAIGRVLPENVAVIEENNPINTALERLGYLKDPRIFGHRGWGLDKLGVTIGAQLAWPNKHVVGILGEALCTERVYGRQKYRFQPQSSLPITPAPTFSKLCPGDEFTR